MDESGPLIAQRQQKQTSIREKGIEPYTYGFSVTHRAAQIHAGFDALEASGDSVRIAGRMLNRRKQGKVSFIDILDGTGKIQVYLRKDEIGDEPYEWLGLYDIARQPVLSKTPIGDAFVVWMTPGMEVNMENMYRVYAARYVAERPPECDGDFAPDGDVDEADLSVFAEDFGRSDCESGAACEGNFDPDNDVDGKDFFKLIQDYGRVNCPRIF